MDSDAITKAVRDRSEAARFPDDTPYRRLPGEAAGDIAHACGCGRRRVECLALDHDVVPERYARNLRTFTTRDQGILLRSFVLVVGLGGLGGAVTEILARAGVGRLRLVDGDAFEESNLNRQLLSLPERLGEMKAATAARRVAEINPAVEVEACPEFFEPQNAARLLSGVRLAVDCLDTVAARFLLQEGCRQARVPLISAALAGVAGQLTTVFPEDKGLERVYGPADQAPTRGAEASLGTLPHCAALMACLQCAEVFKLLLGQPGVLRNRLLLVDLSDYTFERVDLG